MSKYYTEEYLNDLSKNNPDSLIKLITSNSLNPADLTFAAEALGNIPQEKSLSILLSLLENPKALVQEGALYGIGRLMDKGLPLPSEIKELAKYTPSKSIRTICKDLLTYEVKP